MRKQKNSRFRLSAFILFFPALAIILLTACSINEPQSPSWLTTWNVPIANKTYDINEILEDIDDFTLVPDSAGNPGFAVSQDIDTVRVENNLTISGVNIGLKDSIGPVDISPPSGATASTDVNDILSVNLGVIPPASFDYDQALDTVDNFSWMVVESGDLVMSFTNTLDCDLDTFIVTLTDLADDHVVGVSNFPGGLPDNVTRVDTIALDGQQISNALSVNFKGVTILGGVIIGAGPHAIDADISFPSDITVSAARAETPEITKSQTELTALSDSSIIQSSVIATGALQLTIVNETQLPFTIDISSPCIQNGGIDFSVSRSISGNSTTLVSEDLSGYSLTPIDSPSVQYIIVDFNAAVPASAPSQYTISAGDSISVDADLSTITFESVTGRIQPTVVSIPGTQQDLDIPEGLDQARLTQAELTFNLYNNSTVDADFDIDISGDGRLINIAGRVAGKQSVNDPAELTTILVDSDQLSILLNPPPSTILISGEAILNPDYEIATITANDYIYGDIEIYSPFALAIVNPISIDMDISENEIDPDSRPDNFTETFRYGSVDVDIESHLPLGVALTVYIGTVSDSGLYDDPNTLTLGPDTLQAGITDPTGRVVESALSQLSYTLNSDDLAIFDNDTIYFGQQISLLATDSSGVQVMGADYIKIRSDATMQVQIGENLWDEN
ncbi:MAG: hypothetical protein JSU85_03580 [Candidatus Zixiibacteriota bacterium]|nr:MAG: hypothetical protein JSU85_03580 [candidate division Zixibacteria bacterium]